jgi:soluble lytic murein transglycosylase-like protein
MTKHFEDAKFDEQNRTLFAFASYNAGPGNVTAEKIGIETTTYVRNIYKYYAAYKLVREAQETTTTLKEQVAPAKH